MEWDPEGDAERRKEGRARWWLTIAIVLFVLGYGVKLVYEYKLRKAREEAMFR
jgi:hypothetical protein